MKAKIGNVVRRALLSGCVRPVGVAASAMIVTSLTGTAAGAATSASLDRRVSTLESEVRLLKNRAEALKAKGYEGVVRSGNSRVKVTLYGQVNRAVVIGFSRNNTEVHHVDNDTSESRLGFFARARISSDTVIEARFEVRWLENARSSIDDTNDGAAAATPIISPRVIDIGIRNGTWGSLFLGHGSDAADGSDYQDLSGTDIVHSASGCADDALKFGIPNGNQSAGRGFGTMCRTFDGIFQNRIMYVSPLIYGFTFKASHGETDQTSVGVYYYGSPFGLSEFTVAAGFGWNNQPDDRESSDAAFASRGGLSYNSWSGSVSILHKPTGFSISGAGGYWNQTREITGKRPATYFYVKGGWQGKVMSYGKTYLSVDYGQYQHISAFDDFAWVLGFAVVQAVDQAATDLYFGVRYQDARAGGVGLDSVVSMIAGVRIKF